MKFFLKILLFFIIFYNFAFGENFLEIKISDCIAPFFDKDKEIKHYSNIPYYQLDLKNSPYVDQKQLEDSFERYKNYLQKLKEAGYNAISLDDVNHLLLLKKLKIYSGSVIEKRNTIYISYFHKLINEAKKQWLQVFLITDMQFYTKEIKKYVWNLTPENQKLKYLNQVAFEELFETFDDISGIIMRIWEWWKAYNFDSGYYSEIIFKKPEQVNDFLKYILPIFEKYNKKLIFRTWAIWIWKIWNLNINKETYTKVFEGIKSQNIIVSSKITPWDFFRFEQTNPLIWFGDIPQIVEIQIRKEYEWWWDFPNFIWYDYQQILQTLQKKKNVIWIRNWNQTWWWGRGKNILFNFGFYFRNQINFDIVGQLLQNPNIDVGTATQKILSGYNFDTEQQKILYNILDKSREVIKNGWYINEFRQKTLTLHNQNLPPLLRIWWDQITSSPIVLSLIYYSLQNPINTLNQSKDSLEIIEQNIDQRKEAKWDTDLDNKILLSLQNQYKIFEIIYLFKQSFIDYFNSGEKTNYDLLMQKIAKYNEFKKNHPEFNFDFTEINKFFWFGKFQYESWILFGINILAFAGYLYLTLKYRKIKKLSSDLFTDKPFGVISKKFFYQIWLIRKFFGRNWKKDSQLKKDWKKIITKIGKYKNIFVLLWITTCIFITLITPFLFISKYNFFWFLLKLNIIIIIIFYVYTFVAAKIFAKIFHQKIIFFRNLWNIFFVTVPAIVLLELTIIISQIFGEQIFWHMIGKLILSDYTSIWGLLLIISYILIFIIFGLGFTNIREIIKNRKNKKTIYLVFGIGFIVFLLISFLVDYKRIMIFELGQNLYPNYFDSAWSSVWDFF